MIIFVESVRNFHGFFAATMVIFKVGVIRAILQIVIGCMLWVVSTTAQQSAAYSVLSVNEGLSQGMIFDILQCREGFIWIATKHGLNRYDGKQIEVFTADVFDPFSLGHSEVRKLFEDSNGWIWIAHLNGLDIYLPKTGQFLHLHKPDLPLFTGREGGTSPISIVEDNYGAIWITDHDKVWRLDLTLDAVKSALKNDISTPKITLRSFDIPTLPGLSEHHSRPKNIFFSQHYGLLIGSYQGLYKMDADSNNLHLLAGEGVSMIILGEDKKGNVFVKYLPKDHPSYRSNLTTEVGDYYSNFKLGVWDGMNLQEMEFDIKSPGLTHFNKDGTVWIMETNLLRLWDMSELLGKGNPIVETTFNEPFFNSGLLNFLSLTTDHSGIVWLGSAGYGIVKVIASKPNFLSLEAGKTQRAFVQDPHGFIYNMSQPIMGYKDLSFQSKYPNPWASSESSRHLAYPFVFDRQGNGWGMKRNGFLVRIDYETKESRQLKVQGIGLLFSKGDKLVTVQKNGLIELDPLTEESKVHPFPGFPIGSDVPNLYVHTLYEDNNGAIWICAFEGLIKAIPQKDGTYLFEQYKNDPNNTTSLSSNHIICIVDDPLDPDSFLWIGTNGGGLNKMNKETSEFRHFTARQGLPDNVIYGILSDNNGHIWLSSNKGLTRLHTRTEAIKNFLVLDGLQHNEFNTGSYLKTKEGTMLFGGVNGFTVFHPDSLHYNTIPPKVHVTRFKIGNEDHLLTESLNLTLPYHQNFLGFEIAALDFTTPSQNQYKYRLIRQRPFVKRIKEDWVDLYFDNKVQFANLPPGKYTFQAMGSNNDGIWNHEPATVNFVINSPWWSTWWSFLFYAFALSGLVVGIYRYQLRRKIEQQEVLRWKELDEFKSRFFTNITHEFRTPLTVILGVSEQLEKRSQVSLNYKDTGDSPSSSKFNQDIKLIRRNGENLLRLITQILDLSKMENNTLDLNYIQSDIVAYIRYIVESLSSFAATRDVKLEMEANKSSIVMDYEPDRLLQIMYNLISNAIKFSPNSGNVRVRVTLPDLEQKMEQSLIIEVEDNGLGISEQDISLVFNRFYQIKNARNAELGGTGIGLALSKELAKMMGGDVFVESRVGEWTRFTVCLPVHHKAETFVNHSMAKTSFSNPRSLNKANLLHKLKTGKSTDNNLPLLLIIEDSPDVIEYLHGALEAYYNIDFAFNGMDGIEKALQNIPDLLISDVMMPEKDGFEVIQTLKNDERTSHIPMVLLTAKAGVENRIIGLKRGADAYLAKPFNQEELIATLDNLLENRRKLQVKYGTIELKKSAIEPVNRMDSEVDIEDVFVNKVKNIILDQIANSSFTAEDLSRSLTMSRPQLHRKLTALTGKNISQYIRSLRLAKAKELLTNQKMKVSEVAFAVGFDDPKYFSRVFTEEFGVPPSKI